MTSQGRSDSRLLGRLRSALIDAYRTFRSSAGPRFAVMGLLHPLPCPTELTCRYNSMLTYIPVSFLFSFKNFVPVRVKNRVRVRVRVRIRNLIGGAAGAHILMTSYACTSDVIRVY